LTLGVRKLRITGPEVDCRNAECVESGDVSPAQLGSRRNPHRRHEGGGGRLAQAWPRSPGDISDDDLPAVEHFADVLLCLFRGAVRREPEVDAYDTFVGNDVSGYPAADADGVQALVIAESV